MKITGADKLLIKDKLIERYIDMPSCFKYVLVGSALFWSYFGENNSLNGLRSCIEARLFGNPSDLIIEAKSGPAPYGLIIDDIRRDSKQNEPQSRIISAFDEWLMLEKTLKGFLDCNPAQDFALCSLMNISLEDGTNWEYWHKLLQLEPNSENWKKLVFPNAVPIRYLHSHNEPVGIDMATVGLQKLQTE